MNLNLKKILIISDLHGRNNWMYDIKSNIYDIVVFLGDYVDSFDLSNKEILQNLKNIIEFKKNNLDNTILLWGNHEHQYRIPPNIDNNIYKCSGYRSDMHSDLYDLFNNNNSLFLNAYQYKNTIFTHAGIHHGWFTQQFKGNLNENIADQLNNSKSEEQLLALHDVGYLRGGYKQIGGIFWCDKKELQKPLKEFDQVVGHTPVNYITRFDKGNSKVWFTDCEGKENLILTL